MNWKEYIDFVDIGGLTESTYHNVYFRKYSMIKKGKEHIIAPDLDLDFVKVDVITARTIKDVLFDLLCLYIKITKLSPDDANAAILEWCNHNIQPYNIDKLNDIFQDDDGPVYAQEIVELASFSVENFKRDLISLGTHYGFFYALEMLHFGNDTDAMNLYKKYDGWSEYSVFEKYKKKALQESKGDTKLASSLFKKYINEDLDEFNKLLVKKFQSFRISLIIDKKTMKPVHHIAVDSIFDIAWFAFSKMITEDASYIKLQDENYIDDFEDEDSVNQTLPFSRCPICGDYIKRVKNKKYCNKPECQKRRAAIKSRNYTLRKKQKQ